MPKIINKLVFSFILFVFFPIPFLSVAHSATIREVEFETTDFSGKKNNCKIIQKTAEENTNYSQIWEGKCKNGYADGIGLYGGYWSNLTEEKFARYWAQFKKGRLVKPEYMVMKSTECQTLEGCNYLISSSFNYETWKVKPVSTSECNKNASCKKILTVAHSSGEVKDELVVAKTETSLKNVSGTNNEPTNSNKYTASILEYCYQDTPESCGRTSFVIHKPSENPIKVAEGYTLNTNKKYGWNKSPPSLKVLASSCGIGWTASVFSEDFDRSNNKIKQEGKSCGFESASEAIKRALQECSRAKGINCKNSRRLDVWWGYFDGEASSMVLESYGSPLDAIGSNKEGQGGRCDRIESFQDGWGGCTSEGIRLLRVLGVSG